MPVIERWTLTTGGSDCPTCGNHYSPSRARCAVRHDPVDCVPRTVEVVPVAEVERLREHIADLEAQLDRHE